MAKKKNPVLDAILNQGYTPIRPSRAMREAMLPPLSEGGELPKGEYFGVDPIRGQPYTHYTWSEDGYKQVWPQSDYERLTNPKLPPIPFRTRPQNTQYTGPIKSPPPPGSPQPPGWNSAWDDLDMSLDDDLALPDDPPPQKPTGKPSTPFEKPAPMTPATTDMRRVPPELRPLPPTGPGFGQQFMRAIAGGSPFGMLAEQFMAQQREIEARRRGYQHTLPRSLAARPPAPPSPGLNIPRPTVVRPALQGDPDVTAADAVARNALRMNSPIARMSATAPMRPQFFREDFEEGPPVISGNPIPSDKPFRGLTGWMSPNNHRAAISPSYGDPFGSVTPATPEDYDLQNQRIDHTLRQAALPRFPGAPPRVPAGMQTDVPFSGHGRWLDVDAEGNVIKPDEQNTDPNFVDNTLGIPPRTPLPPGTVPPPKPPRPSPFDFALHGGAAADEMRRQWEAAAAPPRAIPGAAPTSKPTSPQAPFWNNGSLQYQNEKYPDDPVMPFDRMIAAAGQPSPVTMPFDPAAAYQNIVNPNLEKLDEARQQLREQAVRARQSGQVSNNPNVRVMAGIMASAPKWMYDENGNMKDPLTPRASTATLVGGAAGDAHTGFDERLDNERRMQAGLNANHAADIADFQNRIARREEAANNPANYTRLPDAVRSRMRQAFEDDQMKRAQGIARTYKSDAARKGIIAAQRAKQSSPAYQDRIAALAARQAKVAERGIARREMRDFRRHGVLPSNPLLQAVALGGPEAGFQMAMVDRQNAAEDRRLDRTIKAQRDNKVLEGQQQMEQLNAQINAMTGGSDAFNEKDFATFKAGAKNATYNSFADRKLQDKIASGKMTPEQVQNATHFKASDGHIVTQFAWTDWQDIAMTAKDEATAKKEWIDRGYTMAGWNAMKEYDKTVGNDQGWSAPQGGVNWGGVRNFVAAGLGPPVMLPPNMNLTK